MTPKEFDKYLRRDKHCWHCGRFWDLIPHHRANRGAGGKNAKAGQVSNIIAMCAEINGLMESDAEWAATARRYGWKISSFNDPSFQPIYNAYSGDWWILENDFTKTTAVAPDNR